MKRELTNAEYEFIVACKYGKLEDVMYLSKNIDIHVNNDAPFGWTCLHGQYEIAEWLIENGANVNSNKCYPLDASTYSGNFELFKFLIDNGANIYFRNSAVLKRLRNYGDRKMLTYILDVDDGKRWKCKECIINTMCMKVCDDFYK